MRSSADEPFDTKLLSFDLELALIFTLSCCLALLTSGCGPGEAGVNRGAGSHEKAVTNATQKSIAPANVDPMLMALTNIDPEFTRLYNRVNTTNYDEWVKRFVEQPMRLDVKIGITTVLGEEYAAGATNQYGWDAFTARHYEYSSTVYMNGTVGAQAMGPHGSMGGWPPKLSDDELRRLDELLAKLPDDGSRLPPTGRRVELTVREGDHWRVRVYNGSNLPPQVVEIRRIIRDYDAPAR